MYQNTTAQQKRMLVYVQQVQTRWPPEALKLLQRIIEVAECSAAQNKAIKQAFLQNNHYFIAAGDLLSEDDTVYF